MKALSFVILSITGLSLLGCSTDAHRRPELRAALDQAQLSLKDAVSTAVSQTSAGAGVQGALVLEQTPIFSVGALEGTTLKNFRIDIVSGNVLSSAGAGSVVAPCAGEISLNQALSVAEDAAGGQAVAVVPDDDVDCAREIQVLVDDVLFEVKVSGDGSVLEKELSDEYTGSGNPTIPD